MAAGVLAEHQVTCTPTDAGGAHDLIGRSFLQHSVLVYTRLVGKGVLPHDRLVGLNVIADQTTHQTAGTGYLGSPDAGSHAQQALAGLQDHDDLLQRGVAGPFTQSVDGAFYLRSAILHRGQRIGHRQAQIVMAMYTDYYILEPRRLLELLQ